MQWANKWNRPPAPSRTANGLINFEAALENWGINEEEE